jgi:hypothetical protein
MELMIFTLLLKSPHNESDENEGEHGVDENLAPQQAPEPGLLGPVFIAHDSAENRNDREQRASFVHWIDNWKIECASGIAYKRTVQGSDRRMKRPPQS